MSNQAPEKIAAATVLLLRDGDQGLEVLMVRRNSKIAFGGAWVFPGGRVDPHELAAVGLTASGEGSGDDTEAASADERIRAAARLAAVREVQEETGLIIDSASLAPWTYWIPPAQPDELRVGSKGRRYTTWFFAAEAPASVGDSTGDLEVAIDHGEIHEFEWLTPHGALERHRKGAIDLVPPTWITLNQLGAHQSTGEALSAAHQQPPDQFHTKILAHDPLTLAWFGDAGYEPGDLHAEGPRHRLILDPSGWDYQRG